jgi:hypothetical protein
LHETCMASTSLHGLASFFPPFPVSAWGWNLSRGLARLGDFLLHGGAVSSKMNGCPLAVSCAVVRGCLAGSLDVHGFCMVSRPCIDEPLRLGYLSPLGCHLVECYWLLSFSSLHGSWQAVGFPMAGRGIVSWWAVFVSFSVIVALHGCSACSVLASNCWVSLWVIYSEVFCMVLLRWCGPLLLCCCEAEAAPMLGECWLVLCMARLGF